MTVYLMGAGPGDPGLLTVRGHALLQTADVILHDRLIGKEILLLAKPDALLIDVGKNPDGKRTSQTAINQLLVDYGQRYATVVRLKGGDPFVFGRGGEELQALHAVGIAAEVVPGVSSSIAAPAYAGVPVTHRQVSTSFAVITGHESPDKPDSTVNYAALAHMETLIFLMGVRTLPEISAALIQHGRDLDTPVVCVEWGTYAHQRIIKGTLATIPDIAQQEKLKSPAIIVVGEVAGLADELAWAKQSPLAGKHLALAGVAPHISANLIAQGAWVTSFDSDDERLYATQFDLVLLPKGIKLAQPLAANSLEIDFTDTVQSLTRIADWFSLSPVPLELFKALQYQDAI